MKIFIACSKHFYYKIEEIKKELESQGHIINMPNSYDEPFKENEMQELGEKEHREWKAKMIKKDKENIKPNDAILVLNLEKKGIPNYIGGATFLEIYRAWEMKKKIFFYNPLPKCSFTDELKGFNPTILNKNLSNLK